MTLKKITLPAIAFVAGLLIVSQVNAQSGARSAVPSAPSPSFSAPVQSFGGSATRSFGSAPVQQSFSQPSFGGSATRSFGGSTGGSSTRALPSPQQSLGYQAPTTQYSAPTTQYSAPTTQYTPQYSAPTTQYTPQYTPQYSAPQYSAPVSNYQYSAPVQYQAPVYSSPVYRPAYRGGCGGCCGGY